MAYDRNDTRDERARWPEGRYSDRSRDWDRERNRGYSGREDRGFFERAGDEISSWFGDDDAERRRREDRMRDEREGRSNREYAGDRSRDRGEFWRDRTWSSGDFGRERDRDRGYRPMAGDYGRSQGFFAAGGTGGERDFSRSRNEDPHYHAWRQRHINELDRDYDDYARENQSRFESDFGSWRERRMQKRGLLGQIREHMEVVGNDDEHVGTIDCVRGDRIILTKSDPESGGVHHSLSCSEIGRVEGDRVILDGSADQARRQWRDESRSRALFERDDQGEMGPRMLNRSFQGTYRD
jgi:hypothetical protein